MSLSVVVAVAVAVSGCGFGKSAYGTSDDEAPAEVFDAYESIAGRPFPEDVEVLGWRYDYAWLDDFVQFVVETTPERAEELAALELDDEPEDFGYTSIADVSDDRVDAALERRPIRAYERSGVGSATETVIMGDAEDVVTVVLVAFEV